MEKETYFVDTGAMRDEMAAQGFNAEQAAILVNSIQKVVAGSGIRELSKEVEFEKKKTEREFIEIERKFSEFATKEDVAKTEIKFSEVATKGDVAKVEARLDTIDARLDRIDARLDKVDARLDKVERDVADLRHEMNLRFVEMEKKIEGMVIKLGVFITLLLGGAVALAQILK